MSAQVKCPMCGWININNTITLDIEENSMGEDVVTFECRDCGAEASSRVLIKPDLDELEEFEEIIDECMYSDDEEYYNEDMDGDFDSAMASAGFGMDEDYGGCSEYY